MPVLLIELTSVNTKNAEVNYSSMVKNQKN